MEEHDCYESRTLFEIHAERSQNCHRICKRLSQQNHLVLQSTTPVQLKRFKVGSKMAIASFAPVLPNQKKQRRKIARFTDAPCITFITKARLYERAAILRYTHVACIVLYTAQFHGL
jgi:hypothetical protein